ncbi:MAG TPA: hypothetical protein VN836_07800 [Verrucomicrobiae bacterium]|nr:hypothetical protein [Verrucomicrobiae bacterium]
MNPFWNSLYDKSKDRRYGALFLSTIPAFIGLLVIAVLIAAIVRAPGVEDHFLPVLPGIGLLGLAWVCAKFRRAQMRRRERSRHPPLSRDELRVARSKLMKDRV